jgi:hypothetical protein
MLHSYLQLAIRYSYKMLKRMWEFCFIFIISLMVSFSYFHSSLNYCYSQLKLLFSLTGQWGAPKITSSGVLGMMAGVLACTVQSISFYPTTAKLCGMKICFSRRHTMCFSVVRFTIHKKYTLVSKNDKTSYNSSQKFTCCCISCLHDTSHCYSLSTTCLSFPPVRGTN